MSATSKQSSKLTQCIQEIDSYRYCTLKKYRHKLYCMYTYHTNIVAEDHRFGLHVTYTRVEMNNKNSIINYI